jgi:APA family basic amino acid/polyamine antiporter
VYLISSGGMIATASVLLTSILGVSRVGYAMARRGDLPHSISKLHPRYNTPHVSILIGGALMALIVLFVDLTGVVGIGTFAQLFYYGSANASAIRLKKEARRYPRLLPMIGLATCIALLGFVSQAALEIGGACLAVGVAYYILKRKATAALEIKRKNT